MEQYFDYQGRILFVSPALQGLGWHDEGRVYSKYAFIQ